MSKKYNHNESSFFKRHMDALMVVGVNLAIAAILVSMIISESHRIDQVNSRLDATCARIDATCARIDAMYSIIYDIVKVGK